jgi:hypothetical protein
MADFETNPMYKSAHLFFPNQVPGSVMGVLAGSPAAAYIHNFSEICLDFAIKEPNVFSFRLHDLFPKLYSASADASELSQVAEKMSSVCIAMREFPRVMFSS